MPVGGPTEIEIINELNDIYKQAGVTFVIASSGIRDVRYDEDGDGLVQDTNESAGVIIDTLANEPGAIHIYMVRKSTNPRMGGLANSNWSFLFNDVITSSFEGQLGLVAAHEVGHVLGLTSRYPSNLIDNGVLPIVDPLLMRDFVRACYAHSLTRLRNMRKEAAIQ